MNSTYRNINIRTGGASTALLVILLCLASARSTPGQTTPTSTDPMRTIIPVSFDGSNGNITIGGKTYMGNNPGFHIVVLRRQPNRTSLDAPTVVVDANYTSGDAAVAAFTNIETQYPDAMIMVNTAGSYGFPVWSVGFKLVGYGGTTELGAIGYVPLAFVGIVGLAPGTAPVSRWKSTRPVTGYLAPDSNGNYAFIQTDFVSYDITTDGTVKIGSKTYRAADASYKPGCDAAASNSLHLVVVDREAPENPPLANNTYCDTTYMATDLSGVTAEGALVFIASNGRPIPANWNFGTTGDGRFTPLGRQIARLGGYWETIAYLSPNDTYSFVGAPPPPDGTKGARNRARESSSVYPEISANVRPSGELHGVLARSGRGNWYSPLNADPSGYANLGLYEALATPSTPFPRPVGAAEISAFQFISTKLCGSGCNIRNLYDDLNVTFDYKNTLQAMTDPNGLNCDTAGSNADTNFCNVRSQLLTEFGYVSNIRTFYTNLQNLWLGSGTVTILSQLNAYNEVKAQLNPPPTAPSQSLASPLVNFFLGLASFIPEIGPAFGLADVAFNFGTSLTTDTQGNQTIDLTSTIGNLQQQAINQFTAQQSTTGTLFQLVGQEWGKLSALGTALASQKDATSPWYWDFNTTTQILNSMTPAIRQAAYQNIMASAYAIGSYYPDTGNAQGWGWGQYPLSAQPYGYAVIVNRNSPSVPLSFPFYVPAYIPYTYPKDPGNQWADDPRTSTIMSDNTWLGISQLDTPWNGTTDNFQYQPPSEDIRTLLFNPVWKTGLGVYRPAFFNSWPFPRVACTLSFGDRNGYSYPGGCNWSAAAPAPEQVEVRRLPLTSVTIRAIQTSRDRPRQPQVDVQLTVHNNGTMTAQSITIDSITLRTLAGVGQATLLSPALPIRVNNLKPGDSRSVFLKLNVPHGTPRISLTEQGTVTSGNSREPTVHRFSEAQSLFVQ